MRNPFRRRVPTLRTTPKVLKPKKVLEALGRIEYILDHLLADSMVDHRPRAVYCGLLSVMAGLRKDLGPDKFKDEDWWNIRVMQLQNLSPEKLDSLRGELEHCRPSRVPFDKRRVFISK